MKKLISAMAITTALLVPGIVLAEGEGGQQDFIQELADIKAKQKTQQQVLEAISEVAAGAGGGTNIKIGNEAIDSFTFRGDLRVRYDRRARDNFGVADDEARDRMRSRFRVGGVWNNKKENWEVGAGLATGGSSGTSTNDTWSDTDYYKKGDIRLDYAYATHKFNEVLRATLGQQVNPFYSSWVLWDTDLRPLGLTAQFKDNKGIFVTAGATDVYQNGDDISFVFAGQAGYEGKAGAIAYKMAGAYYGFDTKLFSPTAGGTISKRPNPDYNYKIGTLTGEFGGEAGPVKWKTRGEYWKNFGADGVVGKGAMGGTLDPKSENAGWNLGLEGKINDFRLSYDYVVVGADSVNPYLKDSDFGDGIGVGVDVKGHRICAGYNLTKNFSVDATTMLYKPLTRTAAVVKVEGVELYFLDFNYKF